MPVPVSSSNPTARGLECHKNATLPSSGGLFSRLSPQSATNALDDKVREGLNEASDTRAPIASSSGSLPTTNDALRHSDNASTRPVPATSTASLPAIQCKGLRFAYTGDDGAALPGPPLLKDVSLDVPVGARVLLIGANGAGKTTLLRILAGKHMVPESQVQVLGHPPFHTTSLTTQGALSYIGGNWDRDIAFAGYSVPLTGDFPAAQMLNSVPGVDPARRKKIVEVLDIDESWRMHEVSDGQRRRVQIACGLLRPAQVLLLDEVTVDLDVLVRQDLLDFLSAESETRGCTIVYITHIFDGLENWPTHVAFLAGGHMVDMRPRANIPELEQGLLMELVEQFLLKHQEDSSIVASANAGFAYMRNNGYAAGRLASTLA